MLGGSDQSVVDELQSSTPTVVTSEILTVLQGSLQSMWQDRL